MNSDKFDEIVEERLKKIKQILFTKRAEYVPKGGDRLHNFKRAALMLNCSAERALIGMFAKHMISIFDIVDKIDEWGEVPPVELVDEKIGDGINYLTLLEAMIKERIYG